MLMRFERFCNKNGAGARIWPSFIENAALNVTKITASQFFVVATSRVNKQPPIDLKAATGNDKFASENLHARAFHPGSN